MSDELEAFLKERVDEDEQVAQDAHYEGQRWLSEEEDVCRWPDDELVHVADRKRDARHIALWDPARVLAEVQAKRRIIDLHKPRGVEGGPPYRWTCTLCDHAPVPWDSYLEWPCPTLRLLALPYAGHGSYRAEWAPDTEVNRG